MSIQIIQAPKIQRKERYVNCSISIISHCSNLWQSGMHYSGNIKAELCVVKTTGEVKLKIDYYLQWLKLCKTRALHLGILTVCRCRCSSAPTHPPIFLQKPRALVQTVTCFKIQFSSKLPLFWWLSLRPQFLFSFLSDYNLFFPSPVNQKFVPNPRNQKLLTLLKKLKRNKTFRDHNHSEMNTTVLHITRGGFHVMSVTNRTPLVVNFRITMKKNVKF